MFNNAITQHIDLAVIVLYAFWIFFFGLIFYIRREDHREGYPLETDTTGKVESMSDLFIPSPKTFALPTGEDVVVPREDNRDFRKVKAERVAPWPGAPLNPTGNPLVDGVGPAAYAERAEHPDMTYEGEVKIVPISKAEDVVIAEQDPDPRGFAVLAADRTQVGTIADVWVDRSEFLIRYYEIQLELEGISRKVLAPVGFTTLNGAKKQLRIEALVADQFKDVPATAKPDEITLREEDRIMGYYGGGKLYAMANRTEPWL